MRVSSEKCRALCRKNKIKLYIVASCWTIIDTWFIIGFLKYKIERNVFVINNSTVCGMLFASSMFIERVVSTLILLEWRHTAYNIAA
jgi:hypothetical protein